MNTWHHSAFKTIFGNQDQILRSASAPPQLDRRCRIGILTWWNHGTYRYHDQN